MVKFADLPAMLNDTVYVGFRAEARLEVIPEILKTGYITSPEEIHECLQLAVSTMSLETET